MSSTFFKSGAVRQLLGAAGGMLVAGTVYIVIQQLSSFSVSQALLVSPYVVSENAGKVAVNDRRIIDDQSFRRIATQARTVAAALRQQQAGSSTSSQPMVTGNVAVSQGAPVSRSPASAPVYAPEQESATQKQRIQFRNEVAGALRAGEGVSVPAPVPLVQQVASSAAAKNVPAPVVALSVSPVPSNDMNALQGKSSSPEVRERPRGLPSSGFALNFLVIVSLLLSVVLLENPVKRRLVAVLWHTH